MHEGHRNRLRQQIKVGGMDSLSDIQLLEVALFFVNARRDTNALAHRLMDRFGSLSGVLEAPRSELLRIDGIGDRAVDLLHLFVQMERRHLLDRAREEHILSSTEKCGQYLLPYFVGEQDEVVYLLCLDAKCKVLDCVLVHRGAVNQVAISVRQIVKTALACNATSVVVAHNHPSGIAIASEEDFVTTAQIRSALDAVGIVLADHIIVADEDFTSLANDRAL